MGGEGPGINDEAAAVQSHGDQLLVQIIKVRHFDDAESLIDGQLDVLLKTRRRSSSPKFNRNGESLQ